eukprot:Lankesteria_metandrocarpae@DN3786_c0_g1_i1.p1
MTQKNDEAQNGEDNAHEISELPSTTAESFIDVMWQNWRDFKHTLGGSRRPTESSAASSTSVGSRSDSESTTPSSLSPINAKSDPVLPEETVTLPSSSVRSELCEKFAPRTTSTVYDSKDKTSIDDIWRILGRRPTSTVPIDGSIAATHDNPDQAASSFLESFEGIGVSTMGAYVKMLSDGLLDSIKDAFESNTDSLYDDGESRPQMRHSMSVSNETDGRWMVRSEPPPEVSDDSKRTSQ